jgi:uncharacterized protein (TIGR03435 family)
MSVRLVIIGLAIPLAIGAPLYAQSQPAEEKLKFEVASIKPNKAGTPGGWSAAGGRQTIIGTTAKSLIMNGFDLQDFEILDGPSWLDFDRLDVIAKVEGNPTPAQLRSMMRSLLEDRFALKAHRETREGPVYRLVRAKSDRTLGPALLKSDIDCAELRRKGEKPPAPASTSPRAIAPCGMFLTGSQMAMGARTFTDFVSVLETLVDRRIVDDTGLTGAFDVKLEWAARDTDTTRPSIFTAVQEQLGLKLEASRGPINMLVIDRIEHPTPD